MNNRNTWIKIGCFLTGYNYNILYGCSEAARKKVLRYTSAILIVCILWGFIGYTFTNRYLHAAALTSIIGALIMIVIVVQIERQVILSHTSSKVPLLFRCVIAIAMAFIGSLIIDQMIFKDDIDQEKMYMLDGKVDRVLPAKTEELRNQIADFDVSINIKEEERRSLVIDISRNPTIPVYTRQVVSQRQDTVNQETITRTSSQIQNPKIALLEPLDIQIAGLRMQKIKKDSLLLGLRPAVEAELMRNNGFLDELNAILSILLNSPAALFVWLLWFLFLFGLEVFILVSKWNDKEDDYDAMINQQMAIHNRKIELLNAFKSSLGS